MGGGNPFRSLQDGLNNVVGFGLALTVLALGLIIIRPGPVWILLRNVILASLGESTPGLSVEGDLSAPRLDCDWETGRCRVDN